MIYKVVVVCCKMYIQYINLLDKYFRDKNVFLEEQELFEIFVSFKRSISKYICNIFPIFISKPKLNY